MEKVLYMVNGQVIYADKNKENYLSFDSLQKYKRALDNIEKSRQWKEDSEAKLTGIIQQDNMTPIVNIDDITVVDDDRIIYAANFDGSSGIYFKNLSDDDKSENLIIKLQNIRVFSLDYIKSADKIVCSCLNVGSYEQHIMIIDVKDTSYRTLTEGKTIDRNPVFDPDDNNKVYYDCALMGFDEKGKFVMLSNRFISMLNLQTYEITEIVNYEREDFYNPQMDSSNNLYYIKKPYKGFDPKDNSVSIKDIILAPVKLLNAVFNFLDFFTKAFTGQSLNSKSDGQTKAKEKSDKEIFIEGNLLNVEQELKKNMKIGENLPGIVPSNWHLIKRNLDTGKEILLRTGVLDYTINKNGEIIYSNGRYIIKIDKENGQEDVIRKEDFATNLNVNLI